jgi:hypothetical protein
VVAANARRASSTAKTDGHGFLTQTAVENAADTAGATRHVVKFICCSESVKASTPHTRPRGVDGPSIKQKTFKKRDGIATAIWIKMPLTRL